MATKTITEAERLASELADLREQRAAEAQHLDDVHASRMAAVKAFEQMKRSRRGRPMNPGDAQDAWDVAAHAEQAAHDANHTQLRNAERASNAVNARLDAAIRETAAQLRAARQTEQATVAVGPLDQLRADVATATAELGQIEAERDQLERDRVAALDADDLERLWASERRVHHDMPVLLSRGRTRLLRAQLGLAEALAAAAQLEALSNGDRLVAAEEALAAAMAHRDQVRAEIGGHQHQAGVAARAAGRARQALEQHERTAPNFAAAVV